MHRVHRTQVNTCIQSKINVTTCNSMAETIELLPLEKSKSPVWLYFGFPTQGVFLEKEKKEGHSLLQIVQTRLSYKGNTTNMLVHLQYNYKLEYTVQVYFKYTVKVYYKKQSSVKVYHQPYCFPICTVIDFYRVPTS